MLKSAENAEKFRKFRNDSSSVLITSAFYPAKSHKKCRKIQLMQIFKKL
jgi:hypothetical protein